MSNKIKMKYVVDDDKAELDYTFHHSNRKPIPIKRRANNKTVLQCVRDGIDPDEILDRYR